MQITTNSCITLLFVHGVMMAAVAAANESNPHTLFFPIHIQVFESSGFRVFLSPTTFPLVGLQFFAFHSNVNAPIRLMQKGRYEGVVTTADYNGYWLFDVRTICLLAGDVINYWAYVEVNGVGYKIDSRSFMVHANGSYASVDFTCTSNNNLQCIFFSSLRYYVPPNGDVNAYAICEQIFCRHQHDTLSAIMMKSQTGGKIKCSIIKFITTKLTIISFAVHAFHGTQT